MSDIDFFEHEEHVSSKICDVSICKSLIKEPHELKLEYCQQRFETTVSNASSEGKL